ncbi:hypothetical protein, partial [Nitratifractor sp.]|uniref:hypothetical protein n=1 Tax=Nitratifractor sp. TaxID=2268144 RepID=UPI0025D8CD04
PDSFALLTPLPSRLLCPPDEIDLLLAAAAFNLRKWMNRFLWWLFFWKLGITLLWLMRQETRKREKYPLVLLSIYRVW